MQNDQYIALREARNLSPIMLAAEAIQKPLTKSARKNAKRKEKKESESSVDDAAQAINGLR